MIGAKLDKLMPVAAFLIGRIVRHDRRPFRLVLGHALAGNRRMRVITGAKDPTYVAGLGRGNNEATQNEENRVVQSHGGVV